MSDGAWAEKFGYGLSRITPGTNKDLNPSLYPWDSNEYWGTSQWTGYYDSKVSFFAIEKDAMEFTNHKAIEPK